MPIELALSEAHRDAIDARIATLRSGEVWHTSATFQGRSHNFVIIATEMDGLNTGRRRCAVACSTCERFLHEATTGTSSRIDSHLREGRDG